MTMTLEQLHDWITRLPEPFQPVTRQTDAIEAAIHAHAESLRLTRENDEWQTRCLQFQTERDKARAELAALKARIAEAPIGTVVMDERETPIISCDLLEGTRVALVKVEG